MVTYRSAVASDIIDLISLVEEYCEETGHSHDITSIKRYIDFQLGKIPTIIAADEDKVVGAISFVVMPNPFKADEKIGKKIACFVSRDHRDLGVGSELIAGAEKLCKEAGATKFYFASTAAPEGYNVFEVEYVKDL